MTAPFASLEARVNAATLAHLANVTAEYNSQSLPGIFDAQYVDAFGVVSATSSSLRVAGDVEIAANALITITDGTYKVQEAKDDSGMKLLILRKVS